MNTILQDLKIARYITMQSSILKEIHFSDDFSDNLIPNIYGDQSLAIYVDCQKNDYELEHAIHTDIISVLLEKLDTGHISYKDKQDIERYILYQDMKLRQAHKLINQIQEERND